ncbi:MAG: bifunctional 4-hydroxy-2-oxoglutarate aldolase/2-dehydro-3-deoxy-phosphogluconate aldolase [Vulcanococcus sp.]
MTSLRRQPVLAVLRFSHVDEARCQLDQLLAAGLLHVELAVRPDTAWVAMAGELQRTYPALRLGAASVCTAEALGAVVDAGLAYAVSPILDPALLDQASAAGITLVPGVFTPTEVALAVRCGAPAVKLFPAAAVGPAYWRSLAGPLSPLPFCIAAGGLAVGDVVPWLAAGVDAVALGSQLFDHNTALPADRHADGNHDDSPSLGAIVGAMPRLRPDLHRLLADLPAPLPLPDDRQQLST